MKRKAVFNTLPTVTSKALFKLGGQRELTPPHPAHEKLRNLPQLFKETEVELESGLLAAPSIICQK